MGRREESRVEMKSKSWQRRGRELVSDLATVGFAGLGKGVVRMPAHGNDRGFASEEIWDGKVVGRWEDGVAVAVYEVCERTERRNGRSTRRLKVVG